MAVHRNSSQRHFAEDAGLAFGGLRQAVSAVANDVDADSVTEVFWAALHGLTTLARSHRLRPGYDSDRVELLAAQFSAAP